MTELEIFLRFLLAMGLGALVGIERERFAKKRDAFLFGGVRTFTFVSLLGSIVSLLNVTWLSVISFLSFVIILALSYHHSVSLSKGKSIGITAEIAALLVFWVGYLVMTKHVLLAVALSVLIAASLYSREKLHRLLSKISPEEMQGTLVFGIISLVILPFLPDKAFGPLGVFNPHQIWFMVVLICGIGYVGYFLMRIFGAKKGMGMTGFLGGLVSSTAVTLTMAQQSKEDPHSNELVFASIAANTVMLVRVAIAVAVVNLPLVFELLPTLLSMFIIGIIAGWFFWMRSRKSSMHSSVVHKSPFRMAPALTFGALFAIVLFLIKAGQQFFGSAGIYTASGLSGFVDVDAVTLSMASISGTDISLTVGATAIMLAVLSNTLIKVGYSFIFGSTSYSKKIALTLLLMVSAGLATIYFF